MYDALEPRAKAGDVAAAARIFSDTAHCSGYASMARTVELALHRDLPENAATVVLEHYEARLTALKHSLQVLEPVCGEADLELVDSKIYQATLRAAELGNEAAANCFVSASLFGRPTSDRHENCDSMRLNSSSVGSRVATGLWSCC